MTTIRFIIAVIAAATSVPSWAADQSGPAKNAGQTQSATTVPVIVQVPPKVPSDAEQQAQAQLLGQCMVDKTTGADRIAVARWMLSSLASAPQMAGFVTIDAARKIEADKGIARVFTRLMVVDCPDLARPMFKAQNRAGFETAGGALGRIAMKELLANPDAIKALTNYVTYLNESDFAAVVK